MTPEVPGTAAVLAGGLGTRIRSVAGDVPKVILPVAGRPFLGHVFDRLVRQGVSRVVLLLGHAADRVWAVAEEERPAGLDLLRSVEPEPRGTAGALVHALDRLPDETFLLVNGDTFPSPGLAPLARAHGQAKALATLAVVRSERSAEKGSVAFAADGRVTRFAEKTGEDTGFINAGVYVLERSLIEPLPRDTFVSLERDVFPAAVGEGRVFAVPSDAPFVDIGIPDDYLAVRDALPRAGEDDA